MPEPKKELYEWKWMEDFKKTSAFTFIKTLAPILVTIVVLFVLYISSQSYDYINKPNKVAERKQEAMVEKRNDEKYIREWKIKHYPTWLIDMQDRVFY